MMHKAYPTWKLSLEQAMDFLKKMKFLRLPPKPTVAQKVLNPSERKKKLANAANNLASPKAADNGCLDACS